MKDSIFVLKESAGSKTEGDTRGVLRRPLKWEDAINYLLGKLKRIVLESSQAMYLAKEATAEPAGIVSRDSPLHSLQAGLAHCWSMGASSIQKWHEWKGIYDRQCC